MRTIKFRAWDDGKKEWLCGYEMPNLGGFSLIGETVLLGEWSRVIDQFVFERDGHKSDELKIMQYTGLKDKNGKEIYEGDIIWHEFSHKKGQKREAREDGHKFQIIYENNWGSFIADEIVKQGEFQELWHLAQDAKWTDDERILMTEFEIIGNIYENPELLETNKDTQ